MNHTSKGAGIPRPRAFAAMIGLVAFVLAVGSWSRVSATPGSGPIRLSSVQWIFYKEDFNHLNVEDPALIKKVVASPAVYVLEHRMGGDRLPRKVIPAEMFFSRAKLRAAIKHGRVIPGVKFVVDDLENGATTPMVEQKHPIPALKGFADAAHSHGYQPILVPGRDLMMVPGAACSYRSQDTISQAYLRCGLPTTAAYAPIYIIQSSAVETNFPALRQLVREGAAKARKANPNVTIFAMLSVSPNGGYAPASVVAQAAKTIRPYVQGFAVNDLRASDARMLDFLTDLSKP